MGVGVTVPDLDAVASMDPLCPSMANSLKSPSVDRP